MSTNDRPGQPPDFPNRPQGGDGPLSFEGHPIRSCVHNGRAWYAQPDVSKAWGYNRGDGISKIVKRHPDDFVEGVDYLLAGDLSVAPDLGAIESLGSNVNPKTMLLSESGIIIAAALSNCEPAQRFRRWLADHGVRDAIAYQRGETRPANLKERAIAAERAHEAAMQDKRNYALELQARIEEAKASPYRAQGAQARAVEASERATCKLADVAIACVNRDKPIPREIIDGIAARTPQLLLPFGS